MYRLNRCIHPNRCKEGYLYLIVGRNASVGICINRGGRIEFEVRRYKLGDIFVDTEIHWDLDKRYGTAQPIKMIEQAPQFESDKDKLDYLRKRAQAFEKESEEVWWKIIETERNASGQ